MDDLVMLTNGSEENPLPGFMCCIRHGIPP